MRCLRVLTWILGGLLACVSQAQLNEFVPGELLVAYRSDSASWQVAPRLHAAISSRPVERISGTSTERIALPKGMSVLDAVAYYQGRPEVAYAEPNYYRELTFSPNDPLFAVQSQLRQIKCDDAWSITRGKTSVVIAVIDTGIDKNHPDLKSKIVAGWDFVSNDSDPNSTHVHGSHTAGLAAADTNNAVGVSGAGFNSRIMPIRVSPSVTASQSAAAIRFAADHGAKVISMSYGKSVSSTTERSATDYAWSKGCVLLASCGNEGTNNEFYPASYTNVISVGSVDEEDQRSSFSNFGATVDVAAPGEGVRSTVPGGYGNLTGTSMSCPQAAGVVALLWSMAGPETTNLQIRDALLNNCDPVGTWLSYGRVNAERAVESLLADAEVVSDPVSIQTIVGTNPSGSLANILASDGSSYSAQSVLMPAGQVVEFGSNISLVGPSANLFSAQLWLVANGPSGAALTVTARKAGLQQFQTLGSAPLRPTGSAPIAVNLPGNLGPILNGGVIELRLRSVLPRRPFGRATAPYTLGLNYLSLTTSAAP